MGVLTLPEDPDMLDATFAGPDVTAFCRLDGLGLEVTGQRLEPGRAVLACRVVDADPGDRWCRRCGCEGTVRDTVVRELAHEPFGWRPTTLVVTVRRYRCDSCRRVWRQDTTAAANPKAKLTRRAAQWALEALVLQHLTVARVAEALAVAWDTANDAVLAEGQRVLIADPARFDGVSTIGVDEHVWRHTRRGDKYVTVIIDLTPIRNGTGPARLLDMIEGRSKQAFSTWLAARPQAWRDGVDVVAMDGFTGFKTATSQELPQATAVWIRSTSSGWAATRWTAAAAGSNKTCTATGAEPTTRSTGPGGPCTPVTTYSPTSRPRDSKRCSPSTSTWKSRPPGGSTSG